MKILDEVSKKIRFTQAKEICAKLQKAGFQAYFVGGCVRDLLLNLDPHDFDITTSALPDDIMKLFTHHYLTGLKHGTITVSIGTDIKNTFEVTTFRAEGKYIDGRRPEEVIFVNNINFDLARRDFTINSMAFDPISNIYIDPFNGKEDLKKGIIRAVGFAGDRFKEDGLRIMRAARFASKFCFQIEEETFQGMKNNLETLQKVSKERIKDEICKIIMTDRPSYGLMLLDKIGLINYIMPIIKFQGIKTFSPQLDLCKGELETKLAFLYSSCKPKDVKKELLENRFSNKEMLKITFLLELLHRFFIFLQKKNTLSYRAFIAIIKNHSPSPYEETLNEFIKLTEAMGYNTISEIEIFKNEIVYAKNELNLDGNDLLQLGVKQGRDIKEILDAAYIEILTYPNNNYKKYLIEFVKINYFDGSYM